MIVASADDGGCGGERASGAPKWAPVAFGSIDRASNRIIGGKQDFREGA
jgi:hypothetical protein